MCCLHFFLILIFVLIHPDQADSTEPISKTAFKLNTVVTLKIYDSKDETLLDDALAICDKYENIFSRTKESSELYNLNHKTLPQNDGAFTVSSDFADLVSKGLYYSVFQVADSILPSSRSLLCGILFQMRKSFRMMPL